MNEAMRSQRQAVQQRLADAYRSHLRLLRDRVDEYVKKRTTDLEGCAQGSLGSAAFVRCLSLSLGDSIIVLDRNNQPVYPNPVVPAFSDPVYDRQEWVQARRL